MKQDNGRIIRFLLGIIFFFLSISSYAAPVWTFTPISGFPPTVTVARGGGTATIKYTITNQSSTTHSLIMNSITGINQVTTNAGDCAIQFVLGNQQSCTLELLATGDLLQKNVTGGPVVCEHGSPLECYQPGSGNRLNVTVVNPTTTTLTSSLTSLALSVNNTGLNAALTGHPRQITFTNTGVIAATNVTYSASPALPSGTSISPASCGNVQPGATCTLTITPGATATSTPVTLTVQGSNTNTLTPAINVLTYGSTYETGFVFSIDDTYADFPESVSVGGKVAALSDQVSAGSGIIWSSNSSGTFDGGVSIWGIDQISTTTSPDPNGSSLSPATLVSGQSNCNGSTSGSCDSTNIIAFYSPPTTTPAISSSFYAAGRCQGTIGNYSDWYLPAICEEGYATLSSCGTSIAPTIQNMQSNLFDNGDVGGLTGLYWSSTEYSDESLGHSWSQDFTAGGGQSPIAKSVLLGVRCVRAMTPN